MPTQRARSAHTELTNNAAMTNRDGASGFSTESGRHTIELAWVQPIDPFRAVAHSGIAPAWGASGRGFTACLFDHGEPLDFGSGAPVFRGMQLSTMSLVCGERSVEQPYVEGLPEVVRSAGNCESAARNCVEAVSPGDRYRRFRADARRLLGVLARPWGLGFTARQCERSV